MKKKAEMGLQQRRDYVGKKKEKEKKGNEKQW